MTSLVTFTNVSKSYGGKRVLEDFNLTLPAGKIIGLVGPNGSGKTTLIKLLNGLLQPSAGEILVNGHKPSVATKKVVSYLPDTSYLRDHLRVGDIINLFADFYADFDRQQAEKLLADLAIDTKQYLKNLSKGTKEKVQLILVMSRKALLYILDEPIAGVDPATREYILRTIISNYSDQSSVLISTHLIADVEPILDEVVFVEQGHLVLQGDVDDLRADHGKSIDGIFRDKFKV